MEQEKDQFSADSVEGKTGEMSLFKISDHLSGEKMETLADFNKLMLDALAKRENAAQVRWMQNNDRRTLQLIDLVLEKTKTEAMKELLKRTRGMDYMKLEAKIQQQNQDIRRAELERARDLDQYVNLSAQKGLVSQEIKDAMSLVTDCFARVSFKN